MEGLAGLEDGCGDISCGLFDGMRRLQSRCSGVFLCTAAS